MGKTQTKIPYKQIGSNLEIQLLEELRSWKGRASGINQKLRWTFRPRGRKSCRKKRRRQSSTTKDYMHNVVRYN